MAPPRLLFSVNTCLAFRRPPDWVAGSLQYFGWHECFIASVIFLVSLSYEVSTSSVARKDQSGSRRKARRQGQSACWYRHTVHLVVRSGVGATSKCATITA